MTSRARNAKPAAHGKRFFLVTFSPAFHWRIITKRPYGSLQLSRRSWLPYVMDAVSLGVLVLWYFVFFQDLTPFHAGQDIVRADPHDVQSLAGPVIFAFVFFPLHIAIVWRNRGAQIAGWLSLYAGLIAGWILILFGGLFLNIYAGSEGYRHCFNEPGLAVYAHAGAACPERGLKPVEPRPGAT